MILLSFLDFYSFLAFLFLSVFILLKGQKTLISRVCSALLACFSLWSLGMIITRNPLTPPKLNILAYNISSCGWVSFASFIFWLALIFTQKQRILKAKKLLYPLLFIPPLLFIYKQLSGSLLVDYIKKPYGWTYSWSTSIWPYLFYFYYVSFVITALFLIFNFGRKTKEPVYRKQSMIIFWSTLVSLVGGSLTNVVLPELRIYALPPLANVTVLIFGMGVVYAIVKYQFLVITPAAAAENIISTMLESLILLNREGTIIDINDAAAHLLAYHKEELKGKPLSIVLPGYLQKPLLDKIIKGETLKGYDIIFITKHLDNIAVSFSASPLKDSLGNTIGTICVAMDITDRKRIEEALREGEKKYRTIFELSPEGIIVLDTQGKIIDLNSRLCDWLGYRLGEVVGKNIFELPFLPEMDRIKSKEMFYGRIKGEFIPPYELNVIAKNGQKKIGLIQATLIKDRNNQILADLLMISDITDRKLAEEKVRRAADEWRSTFDSITDMISIHDKDFKIIRVNMAFARAFKLHPRQVIGKTCYELMHHSNKPCAFCPHQQTLDSKKPAIAEFFEPCLGVFVEISTSPIVNEKGEVISTVHIVKDITQRKELEKEQQLAQLGRLVADMAHEVNNPLMIISGRAQLSLMEEIKQEGVRKNFNIIIEECQRANGIIQRLLHFSRPSTGERKPLNINNCIDSVVNIVEHQFGLANITIKRNFLENPPLVLGDEHQLQEIFMNLLTNAKDAMPESGTITIITLRKDNFIKIDFQDTGRGMPQETLKKIFQPFFTTKEKGTGLGLAVCYGIIKAHNGEITIESEVGKGTTVTILLPVEG